MFGNLLQMELDVNTQWEKYPPEGRCKESSRFEEVCDPDGQSAFRCPRGEAWGLLFGDVLLYSFESLAGVKILAPLCH